MKRLVPLCLALLLVGAASRFRNPARPAGGWNLAALKKAPVVEWGGRTGLVQEVYYQGEPYRGNPTRVFAYLGRPNTGKGPIPPAPGPWWRRESFHDWAEHWARRGYVALAMDTAGCGPQGPLGDGGPDQSDATKFRDFTDAEVCDMWTYHAVAAVIRGHSLLARLPEVDCLPNWDYRPELGRLSHVHRCGSG